MSRICFNNVSVFAENLRIPGSEIPSKEKFLVFEMCFSLNETQDAWLKSGPIYLKDIKELRDFLDKVISESEEESE